MKTIVLKIWISVFFFFMATALYAAIMLITDSGSAVKQKDFVLLSVTFLGGLAIYYLVLKDNFEKMQEEYEEAGSLKKTVKKWKDGDTK